MQKVLILLTVLSFISCSSDYSRRECIDDDWTFELTDMQGSRIVCLPHDWSMELPFVEMDGGQAVGYKKGGIGTYTKTIFIPVGEKGNTIELYFEGIYKNSEVFVNNKLVGIHNNGYTSFKFDISDYLRYGENNEIRVTVRNEGKNSRWYSGSGIYRHVYLFYHPSTYIDTWDTFITSHINEDGSALVRIETGIDDIITEIYDAGGKHVATGGSEVRIDNPLLWSADSPILYSARISIRDVYGTLDQISIPFGIRSLSFNGKDGFRVNGENVLLKGGCVHHDNGLLGSAAFDDAEYRRVKLLKDNGYNAVRCSHNPPSSAFLYACDRLGMYVIDEAFDQWIEPKNPDDYSNDFKEYSDSDIESMVRRDRNHPCVIMWSIGNEIPERSKQSGKEIACHLVTLIKSLDSTRPVTEAVNDYWDNPDMNWSSDSPAAFEHLDVCGYNYMHWEYENDVKLYPNRVIYGSESTAMERVVNWEYVRRYPSIIGDFIWTALDYLGESGIGHFEYMNDSDQTRQFCEMPWFNGWCGDIDICGTPKPQAALKDVLWGEKEITMLVHSPIPDGKRESVSYWGWPDESACWNWDVPDGEPMKVRIFGHFDSIALFLNGEKMGEVNDEGWIHSFDVPYFPGELKAVGYKEGVSSECIISTTGPASELRVYAEEPVFEESGILSYVWIEVIDDSGRLVTDDDKMIAITVSGDADLIATGNASPVDMDSFRSNPFSTFQGRALAIIKRKSKQSGYSITVNSAGFPNKTFNSK